MSLINCLADIYRKAKAVVILDALVLRLRSTDPVETAVALYCGGKSYSSSSEQTPGTNTLKHG